MTCTGTEVLLSPNADSLGRLLTLNFPFRSQLFKDYIRRKGFDKHILKSPEALKETAFHNSRSHKPRED